MLYLQFPRILPLDVRCSSIGELSMLIIIIIHFIQPIKHSLIQILLDNRGAAMMTLITAAIPDAPQALPLEEICAKFPTYWIKWHHLGGIPSGGWITLLSMVDELMISAFQNGVLHNYVIFGANKHATRKYIHHGDDWGYTVKLYNMSHQSLLGICTGIIYANNRTIVSGPTYHSAHLQKTLAI